MALKKTVKGIVELIPYPVGRLMALVPFSLRLGATYRREKRCCDLMGRAGDAEREDYAVTHFRKIFEYAREKFPCYRELYARAGVSDLKIESINDIKQVPTIDKQWTRRHFGEFKGAYRLNTGGSSGEPTAFWMDCDCWAREWAHMHTIWEKLGYEYTDLKLAIRGKNLGRRPFVYNPVHNEYIVNTYLNVKDYAAQLRQLFDKRRPKWFHGYPSSVYQFILECEQAFGAANTRQMFACVTGLLLSSEYPHPYIVKKFEEYGLRWISWYGHSEMAVLAWADQTMTYRPFVTYGLAEVEDGHLLGTSYHNFDMPLIRYDTGDLVEEASGSRESQLKNGGLLTGFRIKEGRNGDFIEDRQGKRIPLTALIFGRHHKAFDFAEHVQIGQAEPGKATIYLTLPLGQTIAQSNNYAITASLFDFTGVDIDFDIKVLSAPIRTALGKLKLKV